ncbi:MAG: hypothetical protein J4N64_06140 [Chloroflexi bacterium]|nr:hypothetical protein [Chloroflexota bacterium]
MKRSASWKIITALFAATTVVYAYKTKQSHGTFLGVPFDFRMPTWERFKQSFWNPEDPRVFTPRPFGIGWGVNIPQVLKRVEAGKEDLRRLRQ